MTVYNFAVSIYNHSALSYDLFESVSLVRENVRGLREIYNTKSKPRWRKDRAEDRVRSVIKRIGANKCPSMNVSRQNKLNFGDPLFDSLLTSSSHVFTNFLNMNLRIFSSIFLSRDRKEKPYRSKKCIFYLSFEHLRKSKQIVHNI